MSKDSNARARIRALEEELRTVYERLARVEAETWDQPEPPSPAGDIIPGTAGRWIVARADDALRGRVTTTGIGGNQPPWIQLELDAPDPDDEQLDGLVGRRAVITLLERDACGCPWPGNRDTPSGHTMFCQLEAGHDGDHEQNTGIAVGHWPPVRLGGDPI